MSAATVVSRLPGRLRVRHPALRRPRACAAALALLTGRDGVIAVEANPATGGLLLRYDPARGAPDKMEADVVAALNDLFRAAAPQAALPPVAELHKAERRLSPRPMSKRLVNIGMLGSMAATLAALAYGKKLHALMGAAHLVFLAAHLATHRQKLARDLSLS